MGRAVAKCVVVMGAGFALMVAQGCRRQAASAPVQRVGLSPHRVQLDFPGRPLPFERDIDPGAMPRVERVAQRQQVQPAQMQQVQVQHADVQNEAIAAAQRLEDARLLQEQQAESQRQQEELNQDIEQNLKTQEEMEAEPRIQDIPELPLQPAPLESTQPQ